MNFNELLFFKTLPCNNLTDHNIDTCYNYHLHKNDSRRIMFDFMGIINSLEALSDNEIIEKRFINFYNNDIGFEEEDINKVIFKFPPCKNYTEHKYHIINYRSEKCFYEMGLGNCILGIFCSYNHKENKYDSSLEIFKKFFQNILNDIFPTKKKFIYLYKELYEMNNNYIDHKKFLKEIKFKPIKIKSSIFENLHESTKFQTKLQKEIERKNTEDMNELKINIYKELNNITKLKKGEIFSKYIKIENYAIFLSNTIPKKVDFNKLLISFLNSHNGILVYGVDVNSERITGIKMNRKIRDQFRQKFNSTYIDYLMEFYGNIKYKFYDLDNLDLCILVIKIKKIKENKTIFDPNNKSYIIKSKVLDKLVNNKDRIKLNDIQQLNMKEYIALTKNKLEKYYSKKLTD
jgi:hypothetical protein